MWVLSVVFNLLKTEQLLSHFEHYSGWLYGFCHVSLICLLLRNSFHTLSTERTYLLCLVCLRPNSWHTLGSWMTSLLCGSSCVYLSCLILRSSYHTLNTGMAPLISGYSHVSLLCGSSQTTFHWEILITHGKILGTENLLSHCEDWSGCFSMSVIFSIWECQYRNNNVSYYWHFTLKLFLS